MATGEQSAVDGWYTSQLKLVLLGGRNSGKSSLGNLLLGKEEFVTKERTSCLRRLAPVGRHWLTVVDTPGWWCDFGVEDTARIVRRELQGSVAMCSPGPHVFLVAVKAGSPFTERRRRALEEHVGLLGPKVWGHCVVVFTSLGAPEHKRDRGLSESEALGWLRDKCGQRCHLIDLSDGSRVGELLENIQRLVAINGNSVFEMVESVCRAIAEEKRRVEEDAHTRFLNMKTHRAFMRERAHPLPDIRIVLLGAKGSGKTSSLNTILGRDQGRRSSGRTARCAMGRGAAFGRQVTVVDTPGWWMNFFVHESTAFDRGQIRLGPSFCAPGPHAFLLVVRPDRAFSEIYRRAVQDHLELLGGDVWSRVMVLFSFGDWLGETAAEQHVESEGESLRWLVERCGNRTHVLNNRTAGDGFQVRELLGKIEEMVAGCVGGHWRAAGEEEDQLERMTRLEEKRAVERKMKMEQQRREADKSRPLSEVTLVLVGGSKTGKSSCGNTVLGHDCFHTDRPTTSCTLERGRVGDRAVTVLDTPGDFPLTADLLKEAPSCAVLVVVNASAAFTGGQGEALEAQLEGVWRRAVVVFSHGDWLGDTGIEQRLESEGPALRELVAKCRNRYHVLDNKRRLEGSQVLQLMAQVESMLAAEHHTSTGSSAPPRHKSATLCKDLSLMPSDGHQLSNHFKCSESSTESFSESSSECPSVDSSESSSADKQVALPSAVRNSGNATSRLLAVLQDRMKSLSINVPAWLHIHPPRLPIMLLVVPPPCQGPLPDGYARLEHSLYSQRGDWRSLEELEAFIDSYFDTLRVGQALTTLPPLPRPEGAAAAPQSGEHLLLSIERKLSKLDLLEEIREDLAEVRRSLALSWKVIQELRCKSKHQ
ncbi:GTPase IMAP family member 8 [Phyllopteryx taeniolatus]|uniref:GTPase IMAP family member 8 n=1 Tax=Phyllopteryx taeniolatus TaxID=161469 RepID=UPI002AD41C12|nr:GTPase IMAP family member 8 [Phyllopteryx taeniolatus]